MFGVVCADIIFGNVFGNCNTREQVLRMEFRDFWNADSDYVDFRYFSFAVIVNLDLVVGWVP